MTEITFDKKSFLKTLDAFLTQFQLRSTTARLETQPAGDRFQLSAVRTNDETVVAFGPCKTHGEMVAIDFDLRDLQGAILEAHAPHAAESVTLIVGEGLFVKDPAPGDPS